MVTAALRSIVEALVFAAGQPLSIDRILACFAEGERPERSEIRAALEEIGAALEDRPVELCQVAGGWRIQLRAGYAEWVDRLWDEKPPRYSRALLETLALVAYRQPISRGEIEAVRGVSLSQSIIKTLSERQWVRVVGHREIPGRPALFGTTRQFLDDFNLKSLDQLPALPEVRDLDSLNQALESLANPANSLSPAAESGDKTNSPSSRPSPASGRGSV